MAVFREGMQVPNNTADGKTAPAPMDEKARMGKTVIGKDKADASKVPPNDKDGKTAPMPKKYAKGGSVSARADGCCSRGKTKGRMV